MSDIGVGARYAKVLVDSVTRREDKPVYEAQLFDYLIPQRFRGTIQVGHIVSVPFGRKNTYGCVVQICKNTDVSDVREISQVVMEQPHLGEDDLRLAYWMARRYLCHPAVALRCMLPPGYKEGVPPGSIKRRLVPNVDSVQQVEDLLKRAKKQRKSLSVAISANEPLSKKKLAELSNVSTSTVDALVQKDFLKWKEIRVEEVPYSDVDANTPPESLTDAQSTALDRIMPAIRSDRSIPYVLHGVTGSGKTEVYLQAINEALERDLGAILLIPEISLTPQMVTRVKGRFGSDVAVLHSELSPRHRAVEWYRLWRGEAKVALGPRSAIFAPIENLGMIIIDEEHDSAYKQGQAPRYHAREVAYKRSKQKSCPIIMGSATPSLETYYSAVEGSAEYLSLPRRIHDRKMPSVEIVDMRKEWAAGRRSIFSERLHEAIEQRLERGEQTVLFLNRRGYSSFLTCTDCGEVIKCINCNVTLTYHWDDQTLRCHYCDRRIAVPDRCSNCSGYKLIRRGVGTQKVEAAVHSAFPGAGVFRLDTDTASKKGTRDKAYRKFLRGQIDILIGTQMIAKGWDIPAVSLVGVIDADTALNFPDFRSSEHTFQLLTQVAGRAGRGETPGEVVIQTTSPEHPAIDRVSGGELEEFYNFELQERRQMKYPPFMKIARIILRGHPEAKVQFWAGDISRRLEESVGDNGEVVGPAPAPIDRLKGEYRWHMLLKFSQSRYSLEGLGYVLENIRMGPNAPRFVVDVDPIQML